MRQATSSHFRFLLLGQVIALFGSSLSGFALGVFAYKEVGSASIYTAIALANILPMFLLSPLAGAVVDKFPRKWIVLSANLATLCVISILYILASENLLTPLKIIGLVTLNSVFAAFVLPSVSASIPLMVPSDKLSKANGLIALALGLVELATPAMAGILYKHMGLAFILSSNFVVLLIAMAILLVCHVPTPKEIQKTADTEHEQPQGLWASLNDTIQFLWQNPSFSRLVFFYAIVVSLTLAIAILVQPMLLGMTDAQTMGFVLSFASSGILFGSLFMMLAKQSEKHIPLILVAALFVGLSSMIIPVLTTPWMIALGGFFVMCCHPIFDSNFRTLFQRKIDAAMLGRVIGIRNFVLGFSQSILFLLVGPLSDHLFEPAMQADGWLQPTFGEFYGSGQGRGIALLISILGLFIVIATLSSLLSRYFKAADSLKDKAAISTG